MSDDQLLSVGLGDGVTSLLVARRNTGDGAFRWRPSLAAALASGGRHAWNQGIVFHKRVELKDLRSGRIDVTITHDGSIGHGGSIATASLG